MRNLILALALTGLVSGCAPTWFQDFKTNPVKQTDIVLDTATSIQQVAIVVFDQLKPLLPADKQAVFQKKFDGSIIALNKAMDAVRSAVKAAAEAQQEKPDFTKVLADVRAALASLHAVVAEVRNLLKAPPAGATPGAVAPLVLVEDPIGYAELEAMVNAIQ